MSKVSLRRLMGRLAAIALTTAPAGAAVAAPAEANLECERELDADVPIDRELMDEHDAAAALGRSLALAVDRMRPLSATQVVATWALSEDPVRRRAVAHALEWTFPLVGDAIAIDHLSRDPAPDIRVAAARAAWARRAVGGDAGVLDRLREDPDPAVRAVADGAQ